MATHKSAVKRHRQNLERRARNRTYRTRLRNQIRKLRATVEANDQETASKMLPEMISLIDRSIQKGVIAENAASRQKSRLTRLVHSLETAGK